MVGASPSRCSRTEAPGARRVHGLRDLGELERIAEENQVAGGGAHRERVRQGDLAGLVQDEIVQRAVELLAGEEPGGAGEELDVGAGGLEGRVVVVGLDELAVVLGLGIAGGLLEPLEAHAGLPRHFLDLGEQVVDGLVALGRDADTSPAGQQVHDDAGARPRLAGAGRPLDEEVARVQPERERLHRVQVGGLDRRARSEPADAGPFPREDGPEGLIAPVAGVDRFADAQDGRALRPGLDGAARDDRLRQGTRADLRTSEQTQDADGAARIVDLDDVPGGPAGRRIVHLEPGPELVILEGKGEGVNERALHRPGGRAAIDRQIGDRLRVLLQLFRRLAEAVEVGPPRRDAPRAGDTRAARPRASGVTRAPLPRPAPGAVARARRAPRWPRRTAAAPPAAPATAGRAGGSGATTRAGQGWRGNPRGCRPRSRPAASGRAGASSARSGGWPACPTARARSG